MIALGCDHGGFELMKEVKAHLTEKGVEFRDFGTDSPAATDYLIYAKRVAKAVLSGECEKGILICGTGIGISITANKFKGIRCAVCHDVFSAEATRQHNDANVIVLPGRFIDNNTAGQILEEFFKTPFEGGRHQKRIDKMAIK